MHPRLVFTAVAVSFLALSCTEDRQNPTEPSSTAATAKSCPSTDPIQAQICALFGATDLLKSATDLYNNIKTKLTKDPAAAKARAFDLVNFTFKQFYAGKLLDPNGGSSPTTWDAVVTLTCSVLSNVGENCGDLGSLPAPSPSPHATSQVCGPAGCLVRPEDKHSGVSVPPGACPSPCIISVNPLPVNQASPRDGPLSTLTDLDQYPLFRDFALSASFDEFAVNVVVGICHLSPNDGSPFAPDEATEKRLRLAHPNPDTEVGGIEILDRVNAPFLDCSDLLASNDEFTPVIGSGRSSPLGAVALATRGILKRALRPVLQSLLPERAEAAVLGSCCLGGATTKFSPWAAVDPFSGGNILFGVNSSDDGLSLINSQTGAVSFVGRLSSNMSLYTTPVAMGVKPSDGELFVWNNSGDGTNANAVTGVLLTVDPGTGQATAVNTSTPPQGSIGALAFSPGGTLYGTADRVEETEGGFITVSDLVSINPSTGVKTLIGQLGSGLRIGGADFACNGVLYGVELNPFGPERLVTIDLTSGEATVVGTLSQDIGTIGSIVFMPSGTLTGSGFNGTAGDILFDINPSTGVVSNVRSGGGGSQGLGIVRTCPIIGLN
jgi:hypothetical protein